MYCCPECFGDRSLRKDIFEFLSTIRGLCSFCESENVPLLEPLQLSEYFELLISAYQPDPDGELLICWFREDWGLFNHPLMDDTRASDLLVRIVRDTEIIGKPYSPAFVPNGNQLGKWDELRDELRYRNRFFPQISIEYDRLSSLLSFLESDLEEIAPVWFRARIQKGDASYPAEQMGAPPRELATHGRANPAGIPYLYLASDELTCISETRPNTGAVASVAQFRLPTDISIVDLRTPKRTVSPFLLGDAEQVGRMRSDLPFLERLGEELTRPVLPQAAAIDYTPSQFLCEFIKGQGYDGVVYKSSVSDGINLALFKPDTAECGEVRQFQVSRVSVLADPVS